jgi:hypothetical protein
MTPLVFHTYSYFGGRENPDGSLIHSGPKSGEGYRYTAPDGTHYQRNWTYHRDGSPTGVIGHAVTGPVVDGKQNSVLTIINRVRRNYGQQRTEYSVPDGGDAPEPPQLPQSQQSQQSPILRLESSPSEVRQALQDGQVTRKGTTTVNGTLAIALSVPVPVPAPSGQRAHLTLHVDAHTWQPLRAVEVTEGDPVGARVADWSPRVTDRLPATPENIAKATDGESIPAGYTRVDDLSQALAPASHPG